eukprot:CAMPEP_0169067810 /NCGR_PEP_ID=MMETSP1015-20121227/3689_1 /TAXON_ID=342587 /ORGANISM="Karlodinium micrum, Strain CCMP2283" /LENGTH=129 /DNA_ID=CAMNT_0009126583 /DNA_START=625 /DNA_END=1010 /DNA_ORIENTATION=+
MRYDHHCPFVNNCVGQRNYAFFWGFLVSVGCLGVAVAVGFVLFFSHASDDPSKSATDTWVVWVVCAIVGIPTAVLLLGVLGLLSFHCFLACTGKTTKEVLRPSKHGSGDQRVSLFAARGPSLIRARERV